MDATLSWPKNERHKYMGRHGYGFLCGVAVDSYPSEDRLVLAAVNSTGFSSSCYMAMSFSGAGMLADLLNQAVNEIDPAQESTVSVESLMDEYGAWGEHKTWPREDWMYEAGQRDTQLGYWNWVIHKVEAEQESGITPV